MSDSPDLDRTAAAGNPNKSDMDNSVSNKSDINNSVSNKSDMHNSVSHKSDNNNSVSNKSDNAFRTISEVATALDVPQHVLRFWESKFPQLKPLKRGGGRRYYRAEDVQFLTRVRDLLYVDGYTIKGVQKLLRESGGLRAFVAAHEAMESAPETIDEAMESEAEPAAAAAAQPDSGELLAVIADLKDLHARLLSAAG